MSVQGYGVWVPKGVPQRFRIPADLPTAVPATRAGLYDTMGCDWGTTPNYFSPRPTRSEQARAVTISDGTTGRVPLPAKRATASWLGSTHRRTRTGAVVLAAAPDDPASEMSFVIQPGAARSLYVPIDACGQWRLVGDELIVTMSPARAPIELRLIA